MGKRMKKIISFLLSSSMVIGILCSNVLTSYAVSAENELGGLIRTVTVEDNDYSDTNLITNPGFEDGMTGWYSKGDATVTNYEGCALTGDYCGLIPVETQDSVLYQKLTLKANTNYKATAKISIGQAGAFVYFNVKTNWLSTTVNEGKTVYCNTPWVYQDVEFEFNTGDYTDVELCVMKYIEDTTSVTFASQIYVDDVTLYEASSSTTEVVDDTDYELVWADDFNQDSLDLNSWGYELGCIRGVEQQHYVNDKENVYLEDGKLVLKATDRNEEDQYTNPRGSRTVIYNSGSVRTQGKQEFLYGRIEMKAKLPMGQGVFPAFWTLGADFTLDGDVASNQGYGWARCGEIDIMELIGGSGESNYYNRTVWHTAHTDDGSNYVKLAGVSTTIDEAFYNDYHIFGINWSENKIEWYVDNVVVYSVDYSNNEIAKNALNRPQYIQLNLAMGGNWPGDVATDLAGTEFDIDYVYYAQNTEQKAQAAAYYADAPTISGAQDLTIAQGDTESIMANISVTDGYYVDFSIDNGPMFKTYSDTDDKCTSVDLLCTGLDDLESLANLPVGTYNLYYSALPNDVQFDSNGVPLGTENYKIARKAVTLTIVDEIPTVPDDDNTNDDNTNNDNIDVTPSVDTNKGTHINTSTDTNQSTTADTVKTGDNSSMAAYITMTILSVSVIGLFVKARKKES